MLDSGYLILELIQLLPAGRQVSNLFNKTSKNATSLAGDIANKDGLIQPIQLYPAYLSYLALLSYFRTSNQVDNERTFRA